MRNGGDPADPDNLVPLRASRHFLPTANVRDYRADAWMSKVIR
jgi:hypothetical protein